VTALPQARLNELTRAVERAVSRLETAAGSRFHRRAAAAHRVANLLACYAQGIEQRSDGSMPMWRELPWLFDDAVADQLAVVGRDLVAALTEVSPGELVWNISGRQPVTETVLDAECALTELARQWGTVILANGAR
jgi:hypothetical protein